MQAAPTLLEWQKLGHLAGFHEGGSITGAEGPGGICGPGGPISGVEASLSALIKLCLLHGRCEWGGRRLAREPGARSALSEVSPEKSFYLPGSYHSLSY